MRLAILFVTALLWFSQCLAWDKFDHEIFDLVSELEADHIPDFYAWLDLPTSSSSSDIGKAYRKLSKELHPDKNPGVANAHERFSRLGKVQTILRNKEQRERYDFFYKNGVPKWRGTGYYYSRFRPGVGSVLTFLVILTSGLQYLVQSLNYKKDIERVDRTIAAARSAAWGPKLIPLTGRRKVRVSLGGRARADDEGNVVQGRMIDMVVEEDDVYILEGGDLHLLDQNAATQPAIGNTWFISLVKLLLSKVTGGGKGADNKVLPVEEELEELLDSSDQVSDSGSEVTGSGAATPTGTGSKPTKKRKNNSKSKR